MKNIKLRNGERAGRSRFPLPSLALLTLSLGLAGCGPGKRPPAPASTSMEPRAGQARSAVAVDPLAVVLSPHRGAGPIDDRIRQAQDRLRAAPGAPGELERLGWHFVAKARASFDPGYYLLAEHCACALARIQPGHDGALLLEGYALHSEHRFQEAEHLARQLAGRRGLSSDHGLLGDILLDVGRLKEAAAAYQTMIDLRPDSQGLARVARIRWLRGDPGGARDAMRLAAASASFLDVDAAAWMWTELARYDWLEGDLRAAGESLRRAEEFRQDYPPARLLSGRMMLAVGREAEAIALLRVAAKANPLPEYQWVLADALRQAGADREAMTVESTLVASGIHADPRTCALFLATRATRVDLALRLARAELAERSDIFTHDALAWALLAEGRVGEARAEMAQALAEGTRDARLFLHAAVIAVRAGQPEEARRWRIEAEALKGHLFPSEQQALAAIAETIAPGGAGRSAPAVRGGFIRSPSISSTGLSPANVEN